MVLVPFDPLCDLFGPEREHHGDEPRTDLESSRTEPYVLSYVLVTQPRLWLSVKGVKMQRLEPARSFRAASM